MNWGEGEREREGVREREREGETCQSIYALHGRVPVRVTNSQQWEIMHSQAASEY